MDIEHRNNFVELLLETGRAHHVAFLSTNDSDQDWPIWYADFLKEPIAQRFGMNFSKSQLIYCLMDADFEHQA